MLVLVIYLNLSGLNLTEGTHVKNGILAVSNFHEKGTLRGPTHPIISQVSIHDLAKQHHRGVHHAQ